MELITTTDELAKASAALAKHDFVAVDTEFLRESTYWAKLCLIQAAAGEVEVLIDPLAKGMDLAPLWAVMADERVMKVFHAARQDLEIFYTHSRTIPVPLFDTQVAAAAVGLGDSIAYDGLVRSVLGRSVDKSSRFTDWSKRPLSDKQMRYALADVTHLRDLYPIVRDQLAERGREHWLAEDMAQLTDPANYEVNPEEAWRRLKLRKRTAPYLAVLKAAAAWREREAQSRNTPRSWVMKDDVLYEVALQGAATPEAVGSIRSVPKGFERSRAGKELAATVAEALKDPKANAPKVDPAAGPKPAGVGPIADLLKVLLRIRAEDHDVAARLLATSADLEAIARDDDANVPALHGWRREIFGEDALALKRGELALFMEGTRVRAVRK